METSPASPISVIVGHREPRIYTPELRPLTKETSKGFEVIEFARDILREPLLPWQEELVIRALELLPNGRLRFKTVLCLVGRQNGKTHVLRVLALWRMYIDGAQMVLSVAQSLDIARNCWQLGVNTAENSPLLSAEIKNVRYANGEQCLTLTNGAMWRIAAATRGAGRGLSVDFLIVDELREQRDDDSWNAVTPTTTARPMGQVFAISTPGDDQSVVLNRLRDAGRSGGDETLGLFEWSAPDGCDLDDPEAWAYSNPALGHLFAESQIRSFLSTLTPTGFRTEVLCQRVEALNSAIPLEAWKDCADPQGNLNNLRQRVAVCLDIAPDGEHASLVAAALLDDGRVRLDVVDAWTSTEALRAALPGLLERVKPRVFGWFPSGPAAAVTADLAGIRQKVELKGGEVPGICQALAEQTISRRILHPDDALLNFQVASAQRGSVGDGWKFIRKDVGHVDAVYAAAGALHLARQVKVIPIRPVILPTST